MQNWLGQLDRVLRGEATQVEAMRDGKLAVPGRPLAATALVLAVIYGTCVGSYAVLDRWGTEQAADGWLQLLASAVKLPMLFFLTLLITLPSLYVFNALVGSRLTLAAVARLLVAMTAVSLAVLASLGPIVVFFSLSTESYAFMKLLNVAVAAVGGLLGAAFLLRTLHRLVLVQNQHEPEARSAAHPPDAERTGVSQEEPEDIVIAEEVQQELPPPVDPPDADEHPADDPSASREQARQRLLDRGAEPAAEAHRSTRPAALDLIGDRTGDKALNVFRIWIVVFGIVGAQMSWVLRPFIGSPDLPFSFFRRREGNFFEAVLKALAAIFGGGG
jgi:hypothetical protein